MVLFVTDIWFNQDHLKRKEQRILNLKIKVNLTVAHFSVISNYIENLNNASALIVEILHEQKLLIFNK